MLITRLFINGCSSRLKRNPSKFAVLQLQHIVCGRGRSYAFRSPRLFQETIVEQVERIGSYCYTNRRPIAHAITS